MSKAEGKNIGIKFNLPINELVIAPTEVPEKFYSKPVGIYTCSSAYSGNAGYVFDNNPTTSLYIRYAFPQWITVQLPEAKKIAGFSLCSGSLYRAKNVDLYGSNDGVDFTLIYQSVNADADGWNYHTFDVVEPYTYFKWEIKSSYGSYSTSRAYIYEIGLLFTTIRDRSGNESAFTVSGQEYQYSNGPDNNGPLINRVYPVEIVQDHPTEQNSIQLTILDTFRNSQGNLTVEYNQALGNLSGIGGSVGSFEQSFLPIELTEGISNVTGVGAHEHIEASVDGTIEMVYITKSNAHAQVEHITASVSGTVELIDTGIINP